MYKGRLKEMATIAANYPDMLLKLSTSSMALKIAVAKLMAHHKNVMEEKRKDIEYYNMYLTAYSDSDEDLHFSEIFTSVSKEVDQLMLDKGNTDDK